MDIVILEFGNSKKLSLVLMLQKALDYVSLVSEVKWGTGTMQSSLHICLDHTLDYPYAVEESFSYLIVLEDSTM